MTAPAIRMRSTFRRSRAATLSPAARTLSWSRSATLPLRGQSLAPVQPTGTAASGTRSGDRGIANPRIIMSGLTQVALRSRVAIVTGGNHGIGAATARALAARGAQVLISYFRLQDPVDAAIPEGYRLNRAQDASPVVEAIRAMDGRAEALEADLRDPSTPGRLFDAAERAFGPVEILVNNATGWARQDTFGPGATDQHGRAVQPLTVESATMPLEVDGRGSALMIAEFARRH